MNRSYLRAALLLCCTLFFTTVLMAQYAGQDVLRYDFSIAINDSTDQIEGVARIDIALTGEQKRIKLDLVEEQKGKGMRIKRIEVNGQKADYAHAGELLSIVLPSGNEQGDSVMVEVQYEGIPANGLIISKSKHGKRTFFGDNWPNRAHHWLPVVDHPADKAYVTWRVYAPDHYQVIANGAEKQRDMLPASKQVHYVYSSRVPLPTKVMVFGAADFATDQSGVLGEGNAIPVTSWVYEEEKKDGFYDYALALPIAAWMQEYIGPYPFSKLANVQSKTMFGGMENASCIFYHENSIDGKRGEANLFAHEIAHQWFGNSASEADWPHIWLSEGFATYFTHMYVEQSQGTEAMQTGLLQDRQVILAFSKMNPLRPVVDTAETNLMKLLNPNSYQKGSWVLHMLRHRLGDEIFQKAVRTYYERYTLSNATSHDFQQVVEEVSGKDLGTFFNQWLRWPGVPEIEGTWKCKGKKLTISFKQLQPQGVYELPLDVHIYVEGETEPLKRQLLLNKKDQTFLQSTQGKKVKQVVLDPNVWMLMKAKLEAKKKK
ncbi:MAG: M1 family metallopeptidase [Bacteroidia bacterium]